MTKPKIKIAVVIGIVALTTVIAIFLFKKHKQEIYAQQFVGNWEGAMSAGPGHGPYRWRVVVKISEDDGVNRVLIDQIDYGTKNNVVEHVTVGKLAVDFSSESFSYHGVLHNNGNELRGIWKWGQAQLLLNLERTVTPDIAEPLTPDEIAPRAGANWQGLWKGMMTNGTTIQRAYLKIVEPTNGSIRAEWDNIDLPYLIHYPAIISNYSRPHLRFVVNGIGGTYNGNLDDSGNTITGRLRQATFTPMTFVRVDSHDEGQALDAGKNYNYTNDTELPGHWSGTLPKIFGVQSRIILHIAQLPDGSLSASVDNLDRGVFRASLGAVQFTLPDVHIKSRDGKPAFDAKLVNGKLSGQWMINNISEPVTLERRK